MGWDGGTGSPSLPNQFLYLLKVRTPKASLVGEKRKQRDDRSKGVQDGSNLIYAGLGGFSLPLTLTKFSKC